MNGRNRKITSRVSVGLKVGAVSLVIGLLPILAAAQTRLPSATTTIRGTTTISPAATTTVAPATTTTIQPSVLTAPTTTTHVDVMPVTVVSAPVTTPTVYQAVLPEPCPWYTYVNIFDTRTMSSCYGTGTMPATTATVTAAPTVTVTATTTRVAEQPATEAVLSPCRTLDYINVLRYDTLSSCYSTGFRDEPSSATIAAPVSGVETVARVYTVPVTATGSTVSTDDMRIAAAAAVTAAATYTPPSQVAVQPSVQAPPPVISNIRATDVGAQSATISWTTDRTTSGFLDYGPTTMYGRTQLSSSGATSHRVVLTDFAEKGTVTYHFRIRARDAQGLESVSADQVFQVASLAAAVGTAAGSPSAVAPAASLPKMAVESVMRALQKMGVSETRLLTPEEKSALGFPFRVSVQVRTATSARAGTRTIFNYTDVAERDSDFDGLPDDLEAKLGTDKSYEDTDGDGKSDGYEHYISKTDPLKAD